MHVNIQNQLYYIVHLFVFYWKMSYKIFLSIENYEKGRSTLKRYKWSLIEQTTSVLLIQFTYSILQRMANQRIFHKNFNQFIIENRKMHNK